MVEREPEDARDGARGDGDARVHPHDGRVPRGGDEGLVQGGADGVGEEVEGLHEGFHARRRFRVRVFQPRHGDEDLRDADEDVGGRLHGDVHVVGQRGGAVQARGAAARVAVARARGVDDVLDDGGVGEAEGGEDEADGDAGDGLELDARAAQGRVDEAVEDGDEDDDGDGVEVLHQVVRHAVAFHLRGLADEVGAELAVAYPD